MTLDGMCPSVRIRTLFGRFNALSLTLGWGMPQLDRGDPFIAEAAVGFLALMV